MQFTEVFGINTTSNSIRRSQMLRTYMYLGHLQVLLTHNIMAYVSTPYVGMAPKKKWQPHKKCANDTLEMSALD